MKIWENTSEMRQNENYRRHNQFYIMKTITLNSTL